VSVAPGAPGETYHWAPADKDGFGTSVSLTSKVWYTLRTGELTEVFYPDLGTPAVRDLQFIVTDGATFVEREHVTERGYGASSEGNKLPYTVDDATEHKVRLADPRSLTYEQVNTAKSGKYRLTKTYVADPERSTVLIDVKFESLMGAPLSLYVLYDPALSNDGSDDTGSTKEGALLASDAKAASALITNPPLEQASSGFLGVSDGWTDLNDNKLMDWTYGSAPQGNVVQLGKTVVNGKDRQRLTVALGFGATAPDASKAASGSLNAGFEQISGQYADGWHSYLDSLPGAPRSAAPWRGIYDASLMVLAASEDKTHRGAFIASPSMPWVWAKPLEEREENGKKIPESGAYHLVWSRDLYQIVTALLAAGNRDAAVRAVDYLFKVQQKPDGSFPQNSEVDGTPHWTSVQLDEVAFPIVLAWTLKRTDNDTYTAHIKKAADYILANGPFSEQERWENQSGYSPATIAAEIAGLLCAADIAKSNGDTESTTKYEQKADEWQAKVEELTVTQNGPMSAKPYYLRLTKDGKPNEGTTYAIGDGGPKAQDQRMEVDTSFLELVRLGVKPASDPTIVSSLEVVDAKLKVETPSGALWHRFNSCGYGETKDGDPWYIAEPESHATLGRAWPIFAGERGEYSLLSGQPADSYLATLANTANDGLMMPEQVWDNQPPAGNPGFPAGKGTYSATPLIWSHAQFVRLAWSIDAGAPVELPSVVACRYGSVCKP
jgi:glucoamylase